MDVSRSKSILSLFLSLSFSVSFLRNHVSNKLIFIKLARRFIAYDNIVFWYFQVCLQMQYAIFFFFFSLKLACDKQCFPNFVSKLIIDDNTISNHFHGYIPAIPLDLEMQKYSFYVQYLVTVDNDETIVTFCQKIHY